MARAVETWPTLKVLLIGASGVGKSALLLRYCDDEFKPESASATIGVDYRTKLLSVYGSRYRLMLFDTAGQERFRTLSTSFYRGAHGVMILYDICSRASFLTLDRWFQEAKANTIEGAVLSVVGCKLDKAAESREVSIEEGWRVAQAHGALFCEASAKTGENVKQAFVEVVDEIVHTPGLEDGVKTMRPRGTVSLEGGERSYMPGCLC
ncbi:hypothetical protein VTK56DRAFT_8973 [Thermocarpiscus australiensis]